MSETIQMVNSIYLLRTVILYEDQHTSHQYVPIDFQAPTLSPHKQFIVVPFYPEKNDMVLILGENDVHWIGKIIFVQQDDKKVGVYFLKKHPRWPAGKKYIKENSAIHNVFWDCITQKLEGIWMANGI